MTYIWNRADRVPENKMPHVVHECFERWEKMKLDEIKRSPHNAKQIRVVLDRQKKNYIEAVNKYNENNCK